MYYTLALCQVRRGILDENGLMAPVEEDRQAVWNLGPGEGFAGRASSGLEKEGPNVQPTENWKWVLHPGLGLAAVATSGRNRDPEAAAGSYKRAVLRAW